MTRSISKTLLFHCAVASMFVAVSANAQLTTQTVQTAPSWVGNLVLGNVDVSSMSDPASSKEELPGLGHKFELIGVMIQDTDPENNVGNSGASGGGVGGNETISATMTPGAIALAYRNLPAGIKITALTNQLGFKYYFVLPRTCNAGSPRVVLLIDADGNGTNDFAANGHVNPPYTACPQNKWVYQDLADDMLRWEVTPGGAVPGVPTYPFMPWKAFADAVTAAFPNHKVRAGFLVEDSCYAAGDLGCGKAYYDLLTVENRTLEIWQDTVKKQ